MPPLLVAAPASLAGKTAVAVALGLRFKEAGRSVALLRLTGDGHAADDARIFEGLTFNARRQAGPVEVAAASADADVTLIEAPAGDPRGLAVELSARAMVVVAYSDPLPADIPSLCQALGDSCAGVVITRVPSRRLEATSEKAAAVGVRLVAMLPEDRTLAAPSLGAIADALEAESGLLNSRRDWTIDRPVVSAISVDPAQSYFAHYSPSAVIVRGDKPDQQIGALNAGAPCLIITGGRPVLSYVEERAQEEEVPLLKTRCDTLTAVERLESLYAATPFSGLQKVERIAELTRDLDIAKLV